MIKAILLDIDDTILDWDLCSHEAIRLAIEELKYDIPNTIYDAYDKINPKLWHMHEKKEITMDELFQMRFNKIFNEIGVSYDGVLFEKIFRKYILDSHIFIPNAKETLEYLYSKYDVYAASNSTLYQQLRRLSMANIIDYFTDIFVSEELGASKPSREFYDACLKRMHHKKEEIIVIGDSLTSDIFGAYNYGLQSIWFNKKNIKEKEALYTYKVLSLNEIRKYL